LRGDRAQRGGIGGIADHVARLHRRAVGAQRRAPWRLPA
jgi:hypothetical protein